jgi:excisionase family DNA binding protein
MPKYRLFTLRQASDWLQIDVKGVRRLLQDGYLPGYKVGRAWRISLNGLNSFVEKYGNVPPNQLRLENTANQLNNTHLKSDPPRLPKNAASSEETKTNSSPRANNNSNAHRGSDSPVWTPPWRESV